MALGKSPKKNLIWAIWPQIIEQIVKKRWWIVVIVMLVSGAIETDLLKVMQLNYGLLYNSWDVGFSLFSNGHFLLYVANLLFLFMIFDITVDSPFEQHILIGMGSKRQWWRSKVFLLGFSVLVFLFLSLGISLGIASFSLPWQNHWSPGMQASPYDVYLPTAVVQVPPVNAFIQLIILLGLGWLGLGLLVMVFAILTGSSIKGFFAGVSLNVLGIAVFKGLFSTSAWIDNLTFTQRMLIHFHYLENRLPVVQTVGFSIVFFLVWCALFYWWGLSVSQKKEFFGGGLS